MENEEKPIENENHDDVPGGGPDEQVAPLRDVLVPITPGEDYYLPEFDVRAALAEQRRREEARAARLRKLRRVCENFESLILAFILAIVIRQYVAEAYKIPTGSMQPTLMGDQDAERIYGYGDRIVVDKLYYCYNSVSRWDVVVFKYPNPVYISHWPDCTKYTPDPDVITSNEYESCDSRSCHGNMNIEDSKYTTKTCRNYVKRCVALPGERIDIKHGDLYITNDELDDAIPPKPERAQRGLWMRVYFCDLRVDNPFLNNEENTPILWEGDVLSGGTWHTAEGRLFVDPGQGTTGFRLDNIMDRLVVEGNQIIHGGGTNHVGDLRLDTELSLHSSDAVVCYRITEDNCTYALCLRPSGGETYVEWTINAGGPDEKTGRTYINDLNLELDTEYTVSFANVDDTVVVNIPECEYTFRHKFDKGEVALLYEDDINAATQAASAVDVEVSGGRAAFGRLNVLRDIYYTNDKFGNNGSDKSSRPFDVPEGTYFVLGDNSANSSDSREWGVFPHENLVGRALFVFYPVGPIVDFQKRHVFWINRLKLVR